jgi:RNA polymerase sigma factor (sigma-70 family)
MQSPDYGYRMRDSEIVAAVVAGDPDGLGEAYDRYAAPLYAYCRSLLHEPADAADAVQDTFLIAASRLGGLRDRDRLRPWLYAVARNECRRQIRVKATTAALEDAPDVTDETADAGASAEREELRALLREAVRGLNPAEQEVIELQLRQGLDATEVADVLGVSRNHAHALISRARDHLEVCLGVLLVARTGREDCAELDTLLQDWDGHLTVLLRKRLHRHIDRCPVCSNRKRRALAPAMLLGLAPLAALPAALTAPAALRDQVLHLASSDMPEAVAHRAAVAGRSGAFGQHGFPKPLDPPKAHLWQSRRMQLATAVAAVAAIIIATVAIASSGGPHTTTASGATPTVSSSAPGARPGATTPAGATPTGATPAGRASSGPAGPGAAVAPSAGASGPGTALVSAPPSGPGPAHSSAPASAPASPHASTPAPSSSSPAPSASSSSARSSTAAPTAPSSTAPPSTTVVQGTLAVAPTKVLLSLLSGTSITITAAGGPVSWSISEPLSLLGEVNYTPSSGTLQAGQQATVVITVSGLASLDSELTVNPGGHIVTIVLGLL